MTGTVRVILDDDPTGTQTVSDVPIVLRPSIGSLVSAAAASAASAARGNAVWVVTNTRAMEEARAIATVREVVDLVRGSLGSEVPLLLRGDSTLRGHVLAELDAAGGQDTVCLFVPALIELGRVTIGGVHYVNIGAKRVPVGESEYARDHAFGYRSSKLVDWVAEMGNDRLAVGVPLEQLRRAGDTTLPDVLRASPAGTVVVPDAETYDDLAVIASALREVEANGRRVIVRAAASFASVWAGLSSRTVRPEPTDSNILVVCGSYTTGATAQLAALGVASGVAPVYLEAGHIDAQRDRTTIVERLRAELASNGLAILATSRELLPEHQNLRSGELCMDAVIDVVRQVLTPDTAVISKGGITSARVARDAMGAETGWVEGALLPGIPLWRLNSEGTSRALVIVPGNVGDDATLVTAFNILRGVE